MMYKEIWFGSFYNPAYSDFSYIDSVLKELKELGFTTVLLDAKASEDLDSAMKGGEKSEYVKALEHTMEKVKEEGLNYAFLALYLSGDNLYPDIRFSPPILGSAVVEREGKEKVWPRYWSEKAKECMEEHVDLLLSTYTENRSDILCSMWDPIVSPSFDGDGNERYISFLKDKYKSIDNLNKRYKSKYKSFDDLKIDALWIDKPTKENLRKTEDNREWQKRELALYFEDMRKRITRPSLLIPMIAQWGFFLTFDGSKLPSVGLADLWDTANRGVDLYSLKDHLEGVNVISVPVDPDGGANAYVNVYIHRYLSSLNRNKYFLGGLFLGRFLYGDAYETLTPFECIASIAASGASGYRSYGINGLDDGGLFDRMSAGFKESVKKANAFFCNAEKLGEKKKMSIAILFPKEMALSESYNIEGNKERRLDSLGYMKLVLDLGLDCDAIDPEDISNNYEYIIAPSNSLYNGEYDQKIREYVAFGGTLIISRSNEMRKAFDIRLRDHEDKVLSDDEDLMLQGKTEAPEGGAVLLRYKDGTAAVSEYSYKEGRVVQFGYDYGAEYVFKNIPHVPRREKNSAIYPISLAKRQFLSSLIGGDLKYKGLEIAKFEKADIVINHTSYPIEYEERIIAPRDALIILHPSCTQ